MRYVDDNVTFHGSINAPTITKNSVPVVVSSNVVDVVTISQAAYDALGAGRPATRLYLITS